SFPWAFIDRVNQKTGGKDIVAEAVRIDKVIQGEPCSYDVIIDRISQDVPFYRAFLKNAALTGTAVVNNPFWWSADEKFFNNALATKIGVAVPRTVLQPSHQVPPDTNANSFRNLAYPLDWEAIFNYVGWPAFFKPFAGDGGPVAIDFCNPAPDAEVTSVRQANFEWVVEAVSDMTIRKAREHQPGRDNLSWGKFIQASATRRALGEA